MYSPRTYLIVRRPNRNQGFALVISLSLIAFVLLLILSMSTLVRVESQSARISKAKVEARQVALLGLSVALGQLQEAAGADQRVTGRGDLIADENGAPIAAPSRKYLTGVWDTTNDTTNGNFVRWLASAADADGFEAANGLSQESDVASAPAGPETVRLYQIPNQPDEDVIVDKVKFDGGNRKYAFWVADEGVKARANLLASESYYEAVEDGDVTDYALRAPLGAAQTTAVEALEGFEPIVGKKGEDQAFRQKLRKLTTHFDFEMLGLDRSELSALSHDLTTVSYGLLTNAKSGGLKTDLSLGFEHGNFNAGYVFLEEDYEHPLGSDDIRGPSWAIFQDHYNLYKRMTYPSGGVPRLVTNDPVAHGQLSGSDVNAFYKYRHGFHDTYADVGVLTRATAAKGSPSAGFDLPRPTEVQRQPVYLGNMVIISMLSEEKIPGEPKLVTILNPVALMWNPYNVELELHEGVAINVPMLFGIEYRYNDASDPQPYKGRVSTAVVLNNDVDSNMGSHGVNMTIDQGTRFQPGEIKLYTVGNPGENPGSNGSIAATNQIVNGNGFYLRSWLSDARLGTYQEGSIDQWSDGYTEDGLDMPEPGTTVDLAVTPLHTNVSDSFYASADIGLNGSGNQPVYQFRHMFTSQMHALESGLTEGSFEVYNPSDVGKDATCPPS